MCADHLFPAGRSSNGKTAASGAAYRGSNPCLPANLISEPKSVSVRYSLAFDQSLTSWLFLLRLVLVKVQVIVSPGPTSMLSMISPLSHTALVWSHPSGTISATVYAPGSTSWLFGAAGLLSLATMPVAIAATRWSQAFALLDAAFAFKEMGLWPGQVVEQVEEEIRAHQF